MDNKFGAVPLSSDILTKANIGLWAFELDEGQPPRMYGDEAMIGLVGLEHQVPPEEMYHAWYDHIDKGSYDLVHDAVDKMMIAHAEVQYPWHHPDGHTVIVRCGGVRNPAYTKGIRIEGTHQNVTEVLHFDEERMRNLERQKIELVKSQLRADALDFVSNHETDEEQFLEFFGKRIIEIFKCDQVVYRDSDFHRLVFNAPGVDDVPQDVCSVCPFSKFSQISDALYENGSVIMNDCSKGFRGTMPAKGCPARSSFMQQVNSGGGLVGKLTVHYLKDTHTFNADEIDIMKTIAAYMGLLLGRIETRKAEQDNNSRMLALEDRFESIYDVELETGKYSVFIKDEAYDREIQDKLLAINEFFSDLDKNIDLVVYPEDRARAKYVLSKKGILEGLTGKDHFDYYYRVMANNKTIWFKIRVTYKNADKKNVIIGVFNAEEEMTLRQQERIKQQMKMIKGLASEYTVLFYVDLDSGVFTPYAVSNRVPDTLENAKIYEKFSDIYNAFLNSSAVYSEDREIARAMYPSDAAVKEMLAHRKSARALFRRKYGDEYLWTEMNIIKDEDVDEEPHAIAVGFIEKDAEIRKEQAQQLELEKALSMAESANNAKSNFLFNMSHDIRTPMNAILGFTQLAERNLDDKDKIADCIDKIDRSGHHLLGLINDVLEMSRIESGKVTLNEEPIDVRENRKDLVSMLQNLAVEKKINLSFENKGIKCPYLFVDALRMDQVLINIISNAIKYTPEGGKVKCTVEHLDSEKQGYVKVRYTVADNGIGMSKEFVEKIFEPFSRAKSSTLSGIQGTGLGMSIVKKLVDLMGGTIKVQSELGEGTTVFVETDLCIADGVEKKVEEEVRVDFTGKRVLLVEDNELNREIATALLEESGFVVDAVEDGDDAVEKMMKAKSGDYDIILMDIQMPRLDGHEATKQIRALGTEVSKIPILAMTANAFEEDRKAALEAGMNEHIAKPINIEVLKKTLARFC